MLALPWGIWGVYRVTLKEEVQTNSCANSWLHNLLLVRMKKCKRNWKVGRVDKGATIRTHLLAGGKRVALEFTA